MEPVQVVRAFFVLATSTILLGNSIPPIRDTLLSYGSRSIPPVPEKPGGSKDDSKPSKAAKATPAQPPRPTTNNGVLEYLGSFQVPHTWFWHFYLVSVLSSIFWATNVLLQTPIWQFVLKWQQDASMAKFEGSSKAGMTFDQVVLTWFLMAIQGSRRLYESITLAKSSQSRMPILHWVLGVLFYVGTGMAVWVEGISVLRETKPTIYDLSLAGPSIRTFIGVSLFLIASGVQHDCHNYLASLKKYTLPQLPIFRALICPHFSAECVIYLALSIVAAPEGNLVNTTYLTILIFTAINLGITADFNREWYVKKFGEESIEGRWRMVPYFY